jgi:hypothetical protein
MKRFLILGLVVLCASALTYAFVLSNRLDRFREERVFPLISLDQEKLQKKLREDPPQWMSERIRKDLLPYASGIPSSMIDQAFHGPRILQYKLMRFSVVNGSIICGEQEEMLHKRHFREVLRFLKTLNHYAKLPNVDFILSCEDGFVENPDLGPCFVFAKREDLESLILVPDYLSMTGHSSLQKHIVAGNQKFPWSRKSDKAFWRGVSSGGHLTASNWEELPRAKLALLSLSHPQEIDASFNHITQSDPDVPELMKKHGVVTGSVEKIDHLRYKYLLDVDGNSCTFDRLYWLLLSNSLVIKQVTSNVQWYYGGLKPYTHYLPIQEDFSDLVDQISWARNHEVEVEEMAKRATQFAEDHLSIEDLMVYMYHLIQAYSRLQV